MTLWKKSATELAKIFANGEASAVEITQAHLNRIDEVNPKVNAISVRIDEQALAAAKAIDKARAKGEPLGPLAGVPFTIKSNIDIMGSPTDNGILALKGAVPPIDTPVIARMKAAGGIPLARTNLPDLGLRLHTDSSLHGQTLNPWNSAHTPGGSSGGEAVALATGMSPIGLGNDLGGSLRNPATCCSIASIKPTFGRVPHLAIIPASPNSIMSQILAVEGTLARTVDDVKLGLGILSGAHPLDAWSMPIPLMQKPGKKRIAMMASPPEGNTDERVAAVVKEAARVLREAGHIVEEVAVPEYGATVQCWKDIVLGNIDAGIEEMRPLVGEAAINFLINGVKPTGTYTAEKIAQAWINRHQLIGAWNNFFLNWDVVLTPTWTQLPSKAGSDASPEGALNILETARPVYPGNVLGLPSAAVPAGLVNGLPVGVLLTGPYWSELDCLGLAKCIEDAKIAPQTPIDPKF